MRYILVMIALLMMGSVSALSISPASQMFDTPGKHQFNIIVHSDGEEGLLHIGIDGDLAQYITFDRREYEMQAGDVLFRGVIDLPENILPGDHEQHIIAGVSRAGEGTVVGNVEVVSKLIARHRYDGPYLVPDLYAAPDAGAKDTTLIYLTLDNRGNVPVTPRSIELHAEGINEFIAPIEIAAGGVSRFTITVHGRGEYLLNLIITGESPVQKEYTIRIGHPLITLLTADIQQEASTIRPVLVTAEVSWNAPVDATIIINGKSYITQINKTFQEMYYVETNATSIPVKIIIGTEERSVAAELPQATVPASSNFLWIFLLMALLFLVSFVLFKYWKNKV